jgi:hypothetical protein
MAELNLTTSIKYINKVLNRLDYFIKNECSVDANKMGLNELEGIKEGYTQLIWMESVCKDMIDNIANIKNRYEVAINPVLDNIRYTVNNTHTLVSLNSLKIPGFHLLYSPIANEWGNEQEKIDVVEEIVSLKINGYPHDNKITDPLENLFKNQYRYCVGVVDIQQIKHIEQDKHKIDNSQKHISLNIIGDYEYECGNMSIKFPIINNIKNIPPSLYYYCGDDVGNERGIYIKLINNVIAKIPMVDVLPDDKGVKVHTVKCINSKDCKVWYCTFAHDGVPYNKIGYTSRCPSNPRFSNKDTLKEDIYRVDYPSLRLCLLSSLTDLFSIVAWCQEKKTDQSKEIILTDLDLCGDYKDPFIEGVDKMEVM